MQQMFSCPNCGELATYGDPFCQSCGAEFDWSDEQATYDYPEEQAAHQPAKRRFGRNQNSRRSQFAAGSSLNGYQLRNTINKYHQIAQDKKRLLLIVLGSFFFVFIATIGTVVAINGTSSGTSPVDQPNNTPTSPSQTSPSDNVPLAKPANVVKFSADPTVIPQGQTSRLSWEVTGATALSIDQNIGDVSASGAVEVTPISTTIYTLTATNAAGTITAKTTVTVHMNAPVVSSFTATPTTITTGQAATLTWNVTGATSVSIQGIGAVPLSGTQQVKPTSTTTYTLSAINSAGVITKETTVTLATGAPVITSFTTSADTLSSGQSATLEWFVTGASSVSLNQGIGSVSEYGSKQVSPTASTQYTLTATNAVGSVNASVTITVGSSGSPVINSFTANPLSITTGESSTLEWNVTGATTVTIDQGIGSVSPSASWVVNPANTTMYTLTATNAMGTANRSVTVNVSSKPVITYFRATDENITKGESTTLEWNITGATSISINDVEMLPGIGQTEDVSPETTTVYILEATNSAGSTTAQLTVNVTQ